MREAAPIALLVIVMLGLAAAWNQVAPVPPSSERAAIFVDSIVDEQIRRAQTLDDVDVLVFGDSSALMGIDPIQLQHELGCRVESLATIGLVGPGGFAHMLDLFLDRGRRAGVVVFFIHGISLKREPSWDEWEQRIIAGRSNTSSVPLLIGARDKLLNAVVYQALFYPLGDNAGAFYGGERGFRAYVRDHAGSAVDPLPSGVPARPRGSESYIFETTDAWRTRMPVLAAAIAQIDADRVFAAITPLPEGYDTGPTRESRAMAMTVLRHDLGLAESAMLVLPAFLPERLMSNVSHPNEDGRRSYTSHLASALAQRHVCQQ